jgi:translation elongation factor EF-1alpha
MEDRMMDVRVGKVTHFFNHLSVAVLELTGELKVGDMILIVGRFTDIEQRVSSMEIDHQKVTAVGAGTEVALKVYEPVRKGDVVYKVVVGQ